MANKRLNAVITIGGAVAGTLGAAFGRVTSETNKVGAAIQRLTDRQRALNAELERVGRSGNNAASLRVQYAQQELGTIQRQISLLRQRDALDKRHQANQAARADIRGKIGGTLAAGAMLSAPIGLAIKEAASFDYELNLIGNTAEMTKAQVADLGRTVLTISKGTGQSATNIRKGMGFLIAAGMKPDQATQFLTAIGKTATASAANVEDLSKMVFTLNDALKIDPAGMQGAIDTLAQAGKEGNVELKDMAALLPVLGSGFVALKMQGREAAATMGAALQIARKGAGTAEQAGTNFENFLNKVMSPETRKKAAKMGLDIEKVIRTAQKNGQNPFEAAVQAIAKVTKGGDQKLLGDLFQDMQVQGFLRPMLQNWEEYKRIKDKALRSDGVIDRDFTTMMNTAQQKMTEVANAAGRLGIALGAVFLGGTGDKSSGLATRIGQVTDFINANQDLVRTTAMVVGGLFGMRLAVLGVAYGANLATGAWIALRAVWLGMMGAEALAGAAAGWTRVGIALRFVGTSLLWVGRALLLNPIGLAITVIAGAVFLIYKYWEPLKAFFTDLWDGIKTTFSGVYDWIVGKVAYLIELAGKVKDKVSGLFPGGGGVDPTENGVDAMGNPLGGGLPTLPPVSNRGGTTIMDNSQTTIQVQQQPGQNARELAAEIERERRRASEARNRGRLVDGVGAQ